MMTALEWIFFSDTHLGKLKKLFPENHHSLAMKEFRKPLEYAVKNGIKTVVHGGDVFDTPSIDHKYSKALIKLFLEFKQLEIYIILGNHDVEDIENNSLHLITLCSELGILPNVTIIQERSTLKLDGVPFHFMPFPRTKFSSKKVVNVAHTEVVGVSRDNNMIIRHGIEVDNKDSSNFVGHIHKQQKVNNNTWFVGGLHQTNFGEQGAKGWYHVESMVRKERLKSKVKFIKNPCAFELINLEISVQEDFAKIEKDPLKLYKLHLSDGVSVPAKLSMKSPNVISIVGFKGGEELSLFNKELPSEMYDGSDVLDEIGSDPIWGLLEFLKKEGLKKVQRKRAIQLVESLVKIGA
jgi:DNA repair exonuclease SbcCD nuclease subunit